VDFQKSMMDKSELYAIRAKSDISQGFEVDDIFTRKDTISGLKSSLWAG